LIKYLDMLLTSAVFEALEEQHGRYGFIFQEDNAPGHGPCRGVLQEFARLWNWPVKSPDLSPIEQVWAYLKRKLRGRRFENEDDLFAAIEAE
jgi:hypothetical protein